MTILDRIITQKRVEVAQHRAVVSERALESRPHFNRTINSAVAAIRSDVSTGIIAEFKRMSPSKGLINGAADVSITTRGYVQSGAACLSVLTDEPFFGGTPADLQAARQVNPNTPILRKDFVIDSYQLLEAKAWGADFVLLIAACLTPQEIFNLSRFAHDLGLEVLLEVHDAQELDKSLCDTIDLVGVNNRNLKTFETSVETSLTLVGQIPASFVRVTESGLQDAATMLQLRTAGYNAFLVGEAFMKTSAPDAALAALVSQLKEQTSTYSN